MGVEQGFLMSEQTEFQIIINNEFIGITTAGTVISTVLVFVMFYYALVERTDLVKYVALYFLSALLGLYADSLLVMTGLGRHYPISERQMVSLEIFSEYLTIICLFLLLQYLLRVDYKKLTWLCLIVFFLMFGLGVYLERDLLFMMVYVVLIMIASVTIALKFRRFLLSVIALLVVVVYSLVFGSHSYGMNHLISLQSWIDLLSAVGLIIYFMYRYKLILDEKNQLYDHLTKDYLTNAYSKAYFLEQLAKEPSGAVVFIDINKFKWVNDHYGHNEGDALLMNFADKLNDRKDFLFARFGGDEFTLFLKKKSVKAIETVGQEVQAAFKQSLEDSGKTMDKGVGISIGVARFDHYKGVVALVNADKAMYKAKDQGNYMAHDFNKGGRIL